MEHIVFLDRATIASQIKLRAPGFAHTLVEYQQTAPEQVVERLAEASIAINNKVHLTAEVLSQLPKLRMIAAASTGTDTVDKAYCHTHGIAITNIRGYSINTVPEHTFALMLALRRNLLAYHGDIRAGEWQKSSQFCFFNHPIHDLGGARLGIIGEGLLGQRVAEIARVFGMKVMFASHKGKTGMGPLYTPWDEVLATSDIISLHSPLTPETRNMLAMTEFRQMRRKPLLINTGRGGLIDESDLEIALTEGLISGVGLDVASCEPPPADAAIMRIAHLPNVIVTPHVAWASDEAMQTLADQLIDNIENFVAGHPTNLVLGHY